MALSTCTTKHALLFTIILVSMNCINTKSEQKEQKPMLGMAVRNISVLLENITDMSSVTSMFLENILNRSADTQSSMDGSLDQIATTQTRIANNQSEIANTQTQMANTLTQVVQLLQMQSQQLHNVTDILSNMNTHNIATSRLPSDCYDLISRGQYSSGYYTIQPWDDLGYLRVYCDMETNNGGWTVFQKRFDGSVDFFLGWDAYEDGFGSPDGEYWLGLQHLHQLTQQGLWVLRIDLADFQDNTAYAEFESFSIGDAESNYTLSIGAYSGDAGDAGDALIYHNDQAFSTKDNDHDCFSSSNCAESYKGAWWYKGCHRSNLNGMYLGKSQVNDTGIVWKPWKDSWEVLKRSEMKMRRIR